MLGIGWAAKVGAVALGLAFIVAGVLLMRFGRPLVDGLNRMYAWLPGRAAYPAWYHRVFGGVLVGFGLLVAVVGGVTAGR